jgi:hypothetical protein
MTLLEVIVALGIAGIVLLGGALLLDQVSDSGERIVRERWAQARDANAYGIARRLLREAVPSFDSTKLFRGDARSLDYYTRCAVPRGWSETCHVTLAIDSIDDSTIVMAQFDDGEQFVVRRQAGGMVFRFFDESSRDSSWLARWATSATLPSALAIIEAADTIVLPVGPSRE